VLGLTLLRKSMLRLVSLLIGLVFDVTDFQGTSLAGDNFVLVVVASAIQIREFYIFIWRDEALANFVRRDEVKVVPASCLDLLLQELILNQLSLRPELLGHLPYFIDGDSLSRAHLIHVSLESIHG
jgi:hypothetical protein